MKTSDVQGPAWHKNPGFGSGLAKQCRITRVLFCSVQFSVWVLAIGSGSRFGLFQIFENQVRTGLNRTFCTYFNHILILKIERNKKIVYYC